MPLSSTSTLMFSIRRFGALALALALASCSSDQATAPLQTKAPAAGPSANLLSNLTSALHLTTATVVRRTSPLQQPITVTQNHRIGRRHAEHSGSRRDGHGAARRAEREHDHHDDGARGIRDRLRLRAARHHLQSAAHLQAVAERDDRRACWTCRASSSRTTPTRVSSAT